MHTLKSDDLNVPSVHSPSSQISNAELDCKYPYDYTINGLKELSWDRFTHFVAFAQASDVVADGRKTCCWLISVNMRK